MKIICVGRNYAKHIEELNSQKPKHPVLFLKPETSVLLKRMPFFIPDFSKKIHHEAELLVKIKRLGKHIQPEFSHKYYDKIGLGIDFTARDLQTELKQKGLPWEKAKGFDGSAVIGREWIDVSEIEDLSNLSFRLDKNGKTVQKGNTSMMLWKIDKLIAHISSFFTLKIGDVIFTGTPPGVGRVEAGDVLEGFIEENRIFKVKVK